MQWPVRRRSSEPPTLNSVTRSPRGLRLGRSAFQSPVLCVGYSPWQWVSCRRVRRSRLSPKRRTRWHRRLHEARRPSERSADPPRAKAKRETVGVGNSRRRSCWRAQWMELFGCESVAHPFLRGSLRRLTLMYARRSVPCGAHVTDGSTRRTRHCVIVTAHGERLKVGVPDGPTGGRYLDPPRSARLPHRRALCARGPYLQCRLQGTAGEAQVRRRRMDSLSSHNAPHLRGVIEMCSAAIKVRAQRQSG